MTARVQHDWVLDFFSSERNTCKRCGLVVIEHEWNTQSESTRVSLTYHKGDACYHYDPGCCERDHG